MAIANTGLIGRIGIGGKRMKRKAMGIRRLQISEGLAQIILRAAHKNEACTTMEVGNSPPAPRTTYQLESVMKVSTDMVQRVWNDDEGVCLEIGPDADGLALELRNGESKASLDWFGEIRLTLHDKIFAKAVGEAILKAVESFRD